MMVAILMAWVLFNLWYNVSILFTCWHSGLLALGACFSYDYFCSSFSQWHFL